MATKGTCPTCKRPGLTLPSKDKCGRCYSRISKGRDPLTNEPVPAAAKQAATEPPKPDLAKEVVAQLIIDGHSDKEARRLVAAVPITETDTIHTVLERIELARNAKFSPPPADDVPTPALTPSIEEPKQEEPRDRVPVLFDSRDAGLFDSLQKAATYNRRSLSDEILFRLDRSFDGARALGALKTYQGA